MHRRVAVASWITLTTPILAQAGAHVVAAPNASPSVAATLTDVVDYAFEKFTPVGLAVAVICDGEVVLEMGRGECAVGEGEAVTPETVFNIASCTKAFTAAAIGKLVERGKLGWDDRVVEHLPQFRLSDPWITQALTVRDLLCHRSGLETFEGDLLWYGTDYDDDEVMRRLAKLPIETRFREQFGYQNLLYMVAGEVVERVDGRPWTEFVEQEFFAKLGMGASATSFASLSADVARAWPHVTGKREAVTDFFACKPAGSIWSSVRDMTQWMRMLLAGGQWQGEAILAPETLHACWQPHTRLGRGGTPASTDDFHSYGLGWFLEVYRGEKLVEHDGGMPGYISKVTLLPARNCGFVLLNNGMDGLVNAALRRGLLEVLTDKAAVDATDGPSARERAFAIIDRIAAVAVARSERDAAARAAREAARQPDTKPSLPLPAYVGRFRDAIYGDVVVEADDADGLHFVFEPARAKLSGTLHHWHFDTFRIDFPDGFLPFALIRFSLDSRGTIEGFTIDCPIDDFEFSSLRFERTAD